MYRHDHYEGEVQGIQPLKHPLLTRKRWIGDNVSRTRRSSGEEISVAIQHITTQGAQVTRRLTITIEERLPHYVVVIYR